MDDNHFFVSNQSIYLNHDIHIFIYVGNNPYPPYIKRHDIYLIYCHGAHYVEIWIIVTLSDHNICKNITQIHDIKIVSPDDKSDSVH